MPDVKLNHHFDMLLSSPYPEVQTAALCTLHFTDLASGPEVQPDKAIHWHSGLIKPGQIFLEVSQNPGESLGEFCLPKLIMVNTLMKEMY